MKDQPPMDDPQHAGEIRDFIERMVGFYDSDASRSAVPDRREAQIITCAEILRFIDGDTRMSDQLADLVPVSLSDLPPRLGGTADRNLPPSDDSTI